jgi:hypothetical protein
MRTGTPFCSVLSDLLFQAPTRTLPKMTSLAVWSLELLPKKKYNLQVERDIRISLATLGEQIADHKSRSSIKLHVEEENEDDEDERDDAAPSSIVKTTVIGNLTPGKVRLDRTFPLLFKH